MQRIPSSNVNNLKVKLQKIAEGKLTTPFVITKSYDFPWDQWMDFVAKDTEKYYSVNADTKTEGAKYTLKQVYRQKIYIQYGLKSDCSLPKNPIIRFYRSLKSQRMTRRIEQMILLIREQFTIKSTPCFINGNYSPVTKTHYDEYHNILLLLGCTKTFYLAAQGAIFHSTTGHPNETSATPRDGSQFTKVVLRPGNVMYIPPGYWHYVESSPNSVMVNFWFLKKR